MSPKAPLGIADHLGRRRFAPRGSARAARCCFRCRARPPVIAADSVAAPGTIPSARAGAPAPASPFARRLAQRAGLDLGGVVGSGPLGRILRIDLEALRPKYQASSGPSAPEPQPEPRTLEQMGIAAASFDLVPLDAGRGTSARRMTESFRDTPHFPLTLDIEIDALEASRDRINAGLDGEGLQINLKDMIIKAGATALKRVPEVNASYTPGGIALHRGADIAVTLAVEDGLVTPIVRAAETKGLARIGAQMKDLETRARDRRLKPEEIQGGTFTLSKLGMFGVKTFTSILTAPQGAILSVGAAEPRPVVKNDQLAIATVMTASLTCDHRAMDGAAGARFLAALKSLLDDPLTMLV